MNEDDDDCGYMDEGELPTGDEPEYEPEEDYYPRSLYGN